jgi:hypothetical protein
LISAKSRRTICANLRAENEIPVMFDRSSAAGSVGKLVCATLVFGIAHGVGADRLRAAETVTAKPAATAKPIPPIPQEELARYQKYAAVLQPAVKTWVASQAQLERNSPNASALTAAVHARFDSQAKGGVSASQAAMLVFIVLMEAAVDQQNDLQQHMNAEQQQSNAKLATQSQMELQMLMDARSKLLQTASDIEKSLNDTDMAIIGNIKQ